LLPPFRLLLGLGVAGHLLTRHQTLALPAGDAIAAGNHVEPMRHFLAAGGQTRDGERDDFAGVMDRTLGG